MLFQAKRLLAERNVADFSHVLLTLGRIQKVGDESLGITLGLAVSEDVELTADRPGLGEGVLGSGFLLVNMETLDGAVQVAEADVADGVGVLGDSLHNGAVGSLHESGGSNAFLLHDELVPAFEGAGGGVTGHNDNLAVLAADFLPVRDLAGVDVPELLGGDFLERVCQD